MNIADKHSNDYDLGWIEANAYIKTKLDEMCVCTISDGKDSICSVCEIKHKLFGDC